MRNGRVLLMVAAALAVGGATASNAAASVLHFEGFEDSAWVAGQSGNWQNYSGGDIERVSSGHAGVTSSSGSAHAILTNLSEQSDVFGAPSLGAVSPYTFFGGSSSSFNGGFTTSLDVYLAPDSWSDGQGFDYSVAAYNQSGSHLRDFIWHLGVDDGDLLVSASNNSPLRFEQSNFGGDSYTVETGGWYTLEHEFYDAGDGTLAVDFNLLDDLGSVLHSITRNNPADDIATSVGGNGYGWFTYNNIDGLAIDNTALTAVPSPTAAMAGLAAFGMMGMSLRRPGRRRAEA